MKLRYDAEVDALSIIFVETTVAARELADGIAAEYDAQGWIVGLELLDVASRFDDPSVLEQVVLEGLASAPPTVEQP